MNIKVSCVICARNEEENLPKVLTALKNQSLPLHQIIVVNDGSTDGTSEIARKLGAHVIDLPYHKESYAATPKLAERFNIGLNALVPCDYVLILGSDDVLPLDCVERIVERMEANPKLVIASGQIVGEPTNPFAPRGGGRLVKTWFWKKHGGLQFPKNSWCWEEWMVYKAMQLGFEVRGFDDVLFKRIRPEKRTFKKGVGDGKSMYALGYDSRQAILRCIHTFLKSPKMGIALGYGWFTAHGSVEQSDLAPWLKGIQRVSLCNLVMSKIKKIGRLLIGKMGGKRE